MRSVIATGVLLVGCTAGLYAQAVRVSGSLGSSADIYRAYGNAARLPSETYRAVARLNVVLFDQIDLPFELYLNSGQIGYQQPFNQFGVTPRIGQWLQLFGGWYSTRVSDFTFGDLRILGGGVELSPGNFRFAFHYGYTRQARNPDSALAFWGEYRRRKFSAIQYCGRICSARGACSLRRLDECLVSPFLSIEPYSGLGKFVRWLCPNLSFLSAFWGCRVILII